MFGNIWPFKKNIEKLPTATMKTIVCIPGFWDDLSELVEASAGKLSIKGHILINVETKVEYEIELCGRDVNMSLAFISAGMYSNLPDSLIDEVERHTSVIYIIGKTGSFASLRLMANTVNHILNYGGIAVKVETAGKAFEKSNWAKWSSGDDADIYELFVIEPLMRLDKGVYTIYSCGMHNIGLNDTIICFNQLSDMPAAKEILNIFNLYQVIDKPVIKEGETFKKALNSPRYIISSENDQPNKDRELFQNMFGMWRLSRQYLLFSF